MAREIKAPEVKVQSSKSFDGLHELIFSESSHRYKLDNKACPGWTTIIKGSYPTSVGLLNWMKRQTSLALYEILSQNHFANTWPTDEDKKKELFKQAEFAHEDVAREAADIGTITHTFAEQYSLGKVAEANEVLNSVRKAEKWPVIEGCIQKYLEWNRSNKGALVMAEEITASITYGVCGKFDRLDRVGKKLRLRDYKTSKSIYPDQFIQLGAYKINIKEWFNLDVEELEVLRFGKDDGAFETMLITDPKEIQMFVDQAIRCKQTYDFKKIENDERFDWRKK